MGFSSSTNNLKPNRTKTNDIIIAARGRKKSLNSPTANLPGIERVKILGVTVSSKLSVSQSVSTSSKLTVTRCAQSFHALRILRNHGLEVNTLQLYFTSQSFSERGPTRSVPGTLRLLTKWQAASWGINPPRCSRWSLPNRRTNRPNLHQLVADVDDALFARIHLNEHHVLQQLIPSRTCHEYGLRSRRHSNYTLNIKTDYDDRNFI